MKTFNAKRKWLTAGMAVAGLCLSTNVLAEQWVLSWDQIQLKAAAGVPNEKIHQYVLTGALSFKQEQCKFCSSGYDGWATISGKWDGHNQDAIESIKIEGGITGTVVAHFKCNADPWVNSTTCVKINITAQQSAPADGINWDSVYSQKVKPITSSQVSLQQAQAFSEAQANNQPPPPPPPPQKKKLVFKDAAIATTHTQNILKPPASPAISSSSNFMKSDVMRRLYPQAEQTVKITNPGEIRGFNLQPEPSGKVINPGEIRGFNPLPETPGKVINPGEIRGFNPQPEPPGKAVNPAEIRAFNPQPEPPGKGDPDADTAGIWHAVESQP